MTASRDTPTAALSFILLFYPCPPLRRSLCLLHMTGRHGYSEIKTTGFKNLYKTSLFSCVVKLKNPEIMHEQYLN